MDMHVDQTKILSADEIARVLASTTVRNSASCSTTEYASQSGFSALRAAHALYTRCAPLALRPLTGENKSTSQRNSVLWPVYEEQEAGSCVKRRVWHRGLLGETSHESENASSAEFV
ncbi:MAG: hypothetical protein KAY37_12070, partial [Phycisphaerae bacterium]|nr:hypothetical protein [Phycisphaerae bacterium]